jgi:hypothetical protein
MTASTFGALLAACIVLMAACGDAQYISPVIASGKNQILNLGLILPLNYPSANTIYYGTFFQAEFSNGFLPSRFT